MPSTGSWTDSDLVAPRMKKLGNPCLCVHSQCQFLLLCTSLLYFNQRPFCLSSSTFGKPTCQLIGLLNPSAMPYQQNYQRLILPLYYSTVRTERTDLRLLKQLTSSALRVVSKTKFLCCEPTSWRHRLQLRLQFRFIYMPDLKVV